MFMKAIIMCGYSPSFHSKVFLLCVDERLLCSSFNWHSVTCKQLSCIRCQLMTAVLCFIHRSLVLGCGYAVYVLKLNTFTSEFTFIC